MCANRRAALTLTALLAAAVLTAGLARAGDHAGHAAPAAASVRTAARHSATGREADPTGAADASNDRSIAEELLAINERIALLSAQLKEVELQANIAAKQRDLASGAAGAEGGYGSALPVVRGIDGLGRHLQATLAWASGVVQTVGEGESLPGGWRVTHIDVDVVELARGAERVRLGFGREPPPSSTSRGAVPYAASTLLAAPR